jgi:hypothetical protein
MKKSIKRIVSSTLSAAMVFSMAAGAFAKVPDDALESKHLEAIKALNALDIMVGDGEGNFRPGDKLTRSEFARIAVSLLGMDDVANASNYPTRFADVPAYHWANGYINVASSQKIIVGDENGNFMPDAEISYVEALAILVRILGYQPMADSKGGWPMGYLMTGSSIGIGNGISASSMDRITREQIAQLAFNSLTINLMEQVGFGSNPSYEVVDKTIIEDTLKVEKITGQVTATPITALSGNAAEKGKFRVGDTTLKSDQNVNSLLGMNVEVYAKNGNAILINEKESNVTEITTSKIKSITASDSIVTIVYDTSSVKFDLDKVAYISNGKKVALAESNFDDLKNGSVLKAVDFDKDGKVDVLFTTTSRNIVVEKADAKTFRVTDKYGNFSVTLNPDKADITITKNGEAVKFEDLKEWDVLSIVESEDKTYYDIRVSNSTVVGKVTETDGSKYTIEGKAYAVAANYKKDINVGDEGTFYLDADGKIAGFDENATISTNYAYLVNGVMGKYNASADLVLLNKEGKVVELSTESSVRFNGTKTSAEDLFTALQDSSAIKQQLITFEVNSDNKIVQINTATENGTPNIEEFLLNAKLTGATYDKEKGMFNKKYGVTDKTLVFSIPAGSKDVNDFTVTNGSIFENATKYDVQLFDLNYNYDAGVVIVTNVEYKTSSEAPIAFVSKVTTALTDNGRVDKLYATVNGESVELNAVSSGLLVKGTSNKKALAKGDMIQYKVNANNEITDINVLFDVEDKKTQSTTKINDDLTMVYGKVTAVTSRTMDLSVNDAQAENYYTGNAKVYFMKKDNTVVESSASEITPFDAEFPILTLAKVYKGEVVEIVLIEQ